MSVAVLAPGARRERAIGDFLFVTQVLCALGFGIAQFQVMRTTIAGVSITWIALWMAFLIVNLVLALNARAAYADRAIHQAVVVYAVWTAVSAVVLVGLLLAGGQWNFVDTVTAWITLGGVAGAITVGRSRGLSISDPMVRAAFAVFFKCVPQLTLAWNIARDGGEGVAAFAIFTGHVMIMMRLLQVWYSARTAGWDRNRRGIVIGEAANEGSWLVTTAVWLAVV